jgi:hypothetical protein
MEVAGRRSGDSQPAHCAPHHLTLSLLACFRFPSSAPPSQRLTIAPADVECENLLDKIYGTHASYRTPGS